MKKKNSYMIRLTEAVHEKLRQLSHIKRIPMSTIVNDAVAKYLQRKGR